MPGNPFWKEIDRKYNEIQEICQEILQFLAGNIAINKDENRKSSFMKVEALRDGLAVS
jgi:hypothetical protein